MNITNRTFYDDNGNVISEEEHKQLLKKFQDDVDAKYNRIVNYLVEQINQRCSNDNQKLWIRISSLQDFENTTRN